MCSSDLQQISGVDHFSLKQIDSTQKGTLVYSRDIFFHATSMVTKLVIVIEGRIEKLIMILMFISLAT